MASITACPPQPAAYRELEKYSCLYRSHGCPESKRLCEFTGPVSIYCKSDSFEPDRTASASDKPKGPEAPLPNAGPGGLSPACGPGGPAKRSGDPGGTPEETPRSEPGGPRHKQLGAMPLELAVEDEELQVWHYAGANRLEDSPPSLVSGGALLNADAYLQSFGAARATLDAFRRYGAEPRSGEPISLIVGHPQVKDSLPFYRNAAPKYIAVSQNEELMHPDFISHEVGHAILDRRFHYDCSSLKTLAAHEAFADSCALIASLQDSEVLWDILRQDALGNSGSRASELGEFWGAGSRNAPVRDLAGRCVKGRESDPHQAGLQFSSGLYRLLLLSLQRLREALTPKDCAGVEVPEEIFMHLLQSGLPVHPFDYQCLSLAAQSVSRAFVNSLELLPQKAELSLEDLQNALKSSAQTTPLPGADLGKLAEEAFA